MLLALQLLNLLDSGSPPVDDTTPDQFTFADASGVALTTVTTSAAITVTGIDAATAITVTGGTYDINGSGTFTSSAGTVSNGDTVRARGTSSGSYLTAVNVTVTIGGVSDTFSITTVADPSGYPSASALGSGAMGSPLTNLGPSIDVAHLGIELKH